MEPTNKAAVGIEAASGGGKRRAREEEELFAARAGGREQAEEQQRLERKRQEREARQRKERKQKQGEEMQREQQQQQRDERRRQQDARVPSGMVVSATVPASRMSREEMARTMPRRMDASTLQVVPPSQKRGALPTFPNPFAGQEARAMAPAMRREWEKIPRNKTPYSPAADIPPTPPLVLPARPFGSEETRGRGKGRQRSTVGEDHREDDEDDDEEQSGRWSSGESTPTPTASSVAAASARRRQEAKFMKPVTLTTPTLQPMGGKPVQVAYPSRPLPSVSPAAVQPGGQERPQSSSSIRLADGREIATVRTDFANLKKVSRPSSGSLTNSASTQEKLIDRKGKGKGLEERQRQDTVPPAPIVRQEKSFISFPTSDDGQAAAAPEAQTGKRITSGPDASLFPSADVLLPIFIGASQPPRMSIVEEEEEAVATEKNASLRSQRNSTNAASLRRASFESSTTALDTPDIERRLSSEFTTPADATDASNRTNRRALLTALVDPPSDVPEAIEPRSNTSAADVAASRPQADSFSTQIEQLQKFVVNSRDDHRPDTAGNRSAFSHVIPITNLLRTRRPGTGQTRFSEAISVARSKRLPSGHGNKPMCRQCFRAGFDCAMNLQLGEGTAGRKAFQDFVAAGGLDAISLAGEDKEGSVTASQALGKNYVDKLGEIAFGESALSRPVTRGAVNDMLEERSRLLADRQKQKTVEEFLAELNQVKIIQDQEDELERAKTSMETEKKDQLQSERKSSLLTRPTAITPTQADETGFGHPPAQGDNQSNYAASSSASSDQLPFLADRWSIWRKTVHLVVLGLWIFSLQCLDSGYVSGRCGAPLVVVLTSSHPQGNSLPMIAAALRADPQSIIPGRLSFIFGEAGGLLFGAGLSCYGRYRLPLVVVVMQGCLCVVIGFTKMSIVLTILRGTSGFLSGVFSLVAMGVVLDLMTTKRHRSIAMAALLAFVVAGQVAGPWVAHLILDLVPWSWLYWLEAVFAVVYCAVYGLTVRETAPESIYRANVINMRRQNDKVWTPEPRPLPTLRILLRDHLMRPFVVLFTHPIVILSALVLAVFLGSLVLALEGLAGVLVAERRMTATLANVVVTVSVALGALAAMAVIVLLSNRRGTQGETQRSRRLYIDEKGFIDSSKPVHGAESNLQPALGAVIAAVVGELTMAYGELNADPCLCSPLHARPDCGDGELDLQRAVPCPTLGGNRRAGQQPLHIPRRGLLPGHAYSSRRIARHFGSSGPGARHVQRRQAVPRLCFRRRTYAYVWRRRGRETVECRVGPVRHCTRLWSCADGGGGHDLVESAR